MTNVYPHWDKQVSCNVIKHIITTKVDYQRSSGGSGIFALLSIGLSPSVNRLSIILSVRSLLSVSK